LFDKNWFNDNIPLKINEIYYELKLKFNNISSNSENKEIFNYTFNHVIYKKIELLFINKILIIIQ